MPKAAQNLQTDRHGPSTIMASKLVHAPNLLAAAQGFVSASPPQLAGNIAPMYVAASMICVWHKGAGA
jgi:hypothetical protein